MKIITAIDFSTATEAVLKTTKSYAKQLNADVLLVHVEPEEKTSKRSLPDMGDAEKPPADVRPELFRLQKDAKALQRCGVKTEAVLLQGPVNKTIVAEAKRSGADLIITGAHGHRFMNKNCVGSTSEGLLKLSKIPILIVP